MEGVNFSVKLIGLIESAEWPHRLWTVLINGEAFDYKTGIGITGSPKLKDVLECLFTDADCGAQSFTDFCDSCGYSSDSIKAFEIYRACAASGAKLRKALGAKYRDVKFLIQETDL